MGTWDHKLWGTASPLSSRGNLCFSSRRPLYGTEPTPNKTPNCLTSNFSKHLYVLQLLTVWHLGPHIALAHGFVCCAALETTKAQCSLNSSRWAAFRFDMYELRCMFLPREHMRAHCSMRFALRCVWRPHLPACHLGRASRSELLQLCEAPLPREELIPQSGIRWITTPTVLLTATSLQQN